MQAVLHGISRASDRDAVCKSCSRALHGNVACPYVTVEASFALHVESAQQDPGNPQSLTFCGACVNVRSASSDSPFRGFTPMAPALRASPRSSHHLAASSCSCAELSLTQSCLCRNVCGRYRIGGLSGAHRHSSHRSLRAVCLLCLASSPHMLETPRILLPLAAFRCTIK